MHSVLYSFFLFRRHDAATPKKQDKPPRFKIIEAHYGIEGINDPDVTEYLLERVRGDYLAEPIGADLFHGFDPVAGAPKRLKVRYSLDGREVTIERPEYSWLILPEDPFLKKQSDDLLHQLKLNKSQYDSDLFRARETYRQCEEERRNAIEKLKRFSPLQIDALQLSSDLLEFLRRMGPPPAPKYSRDQIARMPSAEAKRLIEANDGDYSEACAYHDGDNRIFDLSPTGLYLGMANQHNRMRPWYEKLKATYALSLKSRVEELQNRLTIESLSDGTLLLPVQDFNGIKNVQLIAAKLWEMALKLEE